LTITRLQLCSAFFSSTTCKRLYLQFAEALINRNNTFTGAAYRDDGTILAWELINEARLPQDKSGDTLQVRRARVRRLLAALSTHAVPFDVGVD
jgi:hypothetical protein